MILCDSLWVVAPHSHPHPQRQSKLPSGEKNVETLLVFTFYVFMKKKKRKYTKMIASCSIRRVGRSFKLRFLHGSDHTLLGKVMGLFSFYVISNVWKNKMQRKRQWQEQRPKRLLHIWRLAGATSSHFCCACRFSNRAQGGVRAGPPWWSPMMVCLNLRAEVVFRAASNFSFRSKSFLI